MDEEQGNQAGTQVDPDLVRQRVLLILEQTCDKCVGTKSIMHPQWMKFYLAYPDFALTLDSYEDEVRFNNAVAKFFVNVVPPSHTLCTDCGGHGNKRSEITLEAGLRLIGR